MLRRIYAIYDSVGNEVFGPLMLQSNDGVAVRTFKDALSHRDASHQEDYDLYFLGTLDTETGLISPTASSGDRVFGAMPPVITGAALVAAYAEEASNGAS